jgi:hypothetical protein
MDHAIVMDEFTVSTVKKSQASNSNPPETVEFTDQLAKLYDGPPTFRNLDVVREEEM